MEKTKAAEQKRLAAKETLDESRNRVIWDCGSSLYDSFELNAFKKQLDSAISSRTLSMPHISDRSLPPTKKPASKISRSFQRLIRAVFRQKSSRITQKDASYGGGFGYERSKHGFHVAELSTIPEYDSVSPEIRSLVRRTASERFTNTNSFGMISTRIEF